MTATIGVNTFVWYSPLTDEGLRTIIPRVAGWGFETIELVLENAGDWNPQLAAELVQEYGIQPAVSAVVPPGRNIVAALVRASSAAQCTRRSAALGGSELMSAKTCCATMPRT
jgi:D-psicose/D-tagatose/L-ribulose 3-epimerase